MYSRSGFRSGGTCERTLVPVFVPGEHPNVPSFRFRSGGTSAKPTLLETTLLGSSDYRANMTYNGDSAPTLIGFTLCSFQWVSGCLIRENQTCTKLWLPFCVTSPPPPFPKGNLPFSGTGKRLVTMGSHTVSTESPV